MSEMTAQWIREKLSEAIGKEETDRKLAIPDDALGGKTLAEVLDDMTKRELLSLNAGMCLLGCLVDDFASNLEDEARDQAHVIDFGLGKPVTVFLKDENDGDACELQLERMPNNQFQISVAATQDRGYGVIIVDNCYEGGVFVTSPEVCQKKYFSSVTVYLERKFQ